MPLLGVDRVGVAGSERTVADHLATPSSTARRANIACDHSSGVATVPQRSTHSCVIDGTLTSVVGNHLKLIAWFDNEYGFTSRMIDWLYYWKAHSFR